MRSIYSVILFLFVQELFALTVEPVDIDHLTDLASQVVSGVVVSVSTEALPGRIPAVITKISIDETIKGISSREVTIRQLGRIGPQKAVEVFPGLPRFTVGERIIVFLPQSSPTGFASPVGIGQGVFRELGSKMKGGESLLVNEFQNRTLWSKKLSAPTQNAFKKLKLETYPGRELPLTANQLKTLVRARLGTAP